MNIFNYESKFSQLLMTLADLIILNLMYILCCLPIFTIGAAQAGLFTGIRVMLDKDDDSSCFKAFFKGFANGFKTITVTHMILSALCAVFGYLLIVTFGIFDNYEGSLLPVGICGIGFFFCYVIHCMVGPFHATFGCTSGQLVRNGFLRALLSALLIFLPAGIFLLSQNLFLRVSMGLLVIYYSFAYLLVFTLLKAPFQRLKDHYYASQEPEHPEEPVSEENILTQEEAN